MRRSLLATGLVTALILTACSSDDDAPDADDTTTDAVAPATTAETGTSTTSDGGALGWTSCDEFDDPTLECATLTVPLDHDDPAGDTIDLALVRRPATGDRVGAMLFNPGGPGGSGVELVAGIGVLPLAQTLNERHDLVGFDPRGVDRSNGIDCIDGPTLDVLLALDPTPESDDEAAAAVQEYTDALDRCRTEYGDALRFMSTEQTARDMDAIRAALGDEQISYYGVSYGTYLGGVYATLFPDRVRAMVLDSAFLPDGQSRLEVTRIQLAGFESAFADLAAWCSENAACELAGTDVGARWDALAARLDATPLEVDGRLVTFGVLGTATAAALYDAATWPVLAQAIAAAESGDGSVLQQLADSYNGRRPDGTYSTSQTSQQVITCASGIGAERPADPAAALASLREDIPRFGQIASTIAFFDDCTPLLGGPAPTPDPVSYAGDAPIVVIGGTNDPATPFEYATRLVEAMGPAAHLVTFTGEGHGQSFANDCLQGVVVALFSEFAAPAPDTTCGPDEARTAPSWWSELPSVPDAEAFALPEEALAVLGLDPTVQYLEGWLSSAPSEAVQASFADALTGWTTATPPSPDPGIVATTFEQGDRLFAVITVSQEYLDEQGAGIVGTLVVLAGI